MGLKRVYKWDILPKGVNQEDWQKKSKEDKIHIWGCIYAAGMGSPVVDFLLGLDDNKAILGIEERNLLEFLNYNNDRFETYPIVYDHLERIIKHPRFIKENAIGVFQELKDFIEKITQVKKEVKPPQPIDKNQNRTKKVIFETFKNMDKKGWKYAFATEQDYNLFIDLLTNFFEHKSYSLPETTVQLKRTCKTKIAKVLGEIHAELYDSPLKSDNEYFKIVRLMNHFKDVSDFDLVKAMQR